MKNSPRAFSLKEMRFAIIDLGTNSVRFDVHQALPSGKSKLLHREKLMVRLGQGVFLRGKLAAEARRRTLQAFISFADTCERLRAHRIVAFGTSALREASDGASLLLQIREKTGIQVRVISGAEEARLIARGILAQESPPRGRFALIDIGGGSTEISICRGKTILHSASFPVGTARLQQVFLKQSPPPCENGRDSVQELRTYLRGLIGDRISAEKWPSAAQALGSSGTIKTLFRMTRKTPSTRKSPSKKLSKLVRQMQSKSTVELLSLPEMEAKRVDMILAGGILLEECLHALGAREFTFSPFSLRDGILEEELELHAGHQRSHLGFHLNELEARALSWSPQPKHFKAVRAASVQLFDALTGVHRLHKNWRPYLEAAALLHDIGESVNPSRHAEHSHYLVKNLDLPSLEPWESEFVAQLCLWHAGGEPEFRKSKLLKDPKRKASFLKLLAILRVADALDRAHKGQSNVSSVKVLKGRVELRLDARKCSDLELLRVLQKKVLFEKIFKRELSAIRVRVASSPNLRKVRQRN